MAPAAKVLVRSGLGTKKLVSASEAHASESEARGLVKTVSQAKATTAMERMKIYAFPP
ncbi:hypothetical protein EKH55_5630 (plasmid) [Sinorhizobium alkalisoli]|nr:hypothetical protein EKH55_5630 [Sinorhizobium alkalisoli]